jgi:pimeloyl-ACP methyl ester carboxylesterase
VESRTADLDGIVHYLEFGGTGPPLVCVHGLGGSALNWMAVGPALAEQNRVLGIDLRGFGHTPLNGHSARIEANRGLLDRFLREVVGPPAILMGSSMGGLIAVLQAARRPETVRAVVLVDPALPWPGWRRFDLQVWAFFGALLIPGIGSQGLELRGRRLGAEHLVRETLSVVCAQPERVPAELVQAHVEEALGRLEADGVGNRALIQAGRSLLRVLVRRHYDPVYEAVKAPVLMVHGDRDRLVPVECSLVIGQRHGWQVATLPGVGHVPMMETPQEFLQITQPWLAAL